MHSFSDTFEQPAVEKYKNGDGTEHEVTIPLLTNRDYLPWCEELTPIAQERAKKSAPPATRAVERSNYLANVENLEVTPGDIRPLVFRNKGTMRVLEMALKKAGLDEKQAEAFIDARPVYRNTMLAVRVSGLFRAEEYRELYPDPGAVSDPNELAAMVKRAVAEAIAPLVP
jgi:hypothetical protein